MLKLEVLENSTDPSAYGSYSAAGSGDDDIEKSIENFEKAITLIKKNKKEGKNPWSYHYAIVGQLAKIYMEQRNLEKAKETLLFGLELSTKDPTQYSMLAR